MPQSILIIGSGIAGPPLASFLLLSPVPAQQLPRITILERRSEHDLSKGQNIDIRGTGMSIIRKLGLEAAIRSALTGEEGCQFVDDKSRTWASFPADKTGTVQTGTSDIEILRGRLAKILVGRCQALSHDVQKAGGTGVEFMYGDHVADFHNVPEGVEVKFAKSGETRTFDVVVGADGLQSQTRRMVWGESGERDRLHRLGMYGAFFSMPASPTDSEWRRWFHTHGRRGIMIRPSDEDDITTVFMHITNAHDPRWEAVARNSISRKAGESEQKALLTESFQNAGWECQRIIQEMHTAEDFYYEMLAQVHMSSWNKGRIVLLGDAGYCASPISGMGTTVALNGAYNLAGALLQHPNNHVAAFAQYEDTMRPLVRRAQALPLGGRVHYFLHPETAWGVQVLHIVLCFFEWSGLLTWFEGFTGPPANAVPVPDYEFKQASEWRE